MKNLKAKLLLEQLEKAPDGLVVEIGCIREDHEVLEDGFSTYYIAKWCHENDREFRSFDTTKEAVNIANSVLYKHNLYECVEIKDGKQAIKELSQPISFLFLDSHYHPSFSLEQFRTAELVPGAVVIVDDAQPIKEHKFGKATFIKQLFDHHEIAYELINTASNEFNQWVSLVTKFPMGKKGGYIK